MYKKKKKQKKTTSSRYYCDNCSYCTSTNKETKIKQYNKNYLKQTQQYSFSVTQNSSELATTNNDVNSGKSFSSQLIKSKVSSITQDIDEIPQLI